MRKVDHPQESDRQLVDELAIALFEATGHAAELRGYEVSIPDGPVSQKLDALLNLDVDPPVAVPVEVVRNGYPSSIQAAVWRINAYASSQAQAAGMVIGQISPGARQILREAGVGYFDTDGSLYFRHGSILVNIEKPPRRETRSPRGSPFAGAREKVVHALLHTKGEWTNGLQLAELAQVSPYTVSIALNELSRREWVVYEGKGRAARCKVTQSSQMLDAWVEYWKVRREKRTRWFAFSQNPQRLLQSFLNKATHNDTEAEWALTGAAAGNLLCPLLTSIDALEVIVPPGTVARCASAWGLVDAARGGNVTLIEREDASELFRQPAESLPGVLLASPWIVYLDLRRDDRGRNKELGSQLRERVLSVPEKTNA
ncbi:hypothetical protein FN976_11395 [Caenimonas sedimenti]|uniref:Uncharacterized protein n=1 Tax=Caenimonas sedimenti TaxID=2596921 RepID=A0A562ZT11_9BURK|nr:type IV toxin-antitoxin system AbiEi family antitoxin [Caenimonas sedimenti]TWO71511.1 hypothetical protein FN976_11395 [Caenimonas sedimenti]